MAPYVRLLAPLREPSSLPVLGLTAGLLFLDGLALAYRAHLRGVLDHAFSLSAFEWFAFVLGPFLVAPVLLFCVLYWVRVRGTRTPALPSLLPALAVAVVVGSLAGQYLGVALWRVGGQSLPVMVLSSSFLTVLSPYGARAWVVLLEPLVFDFLVAVAALALAELGRATD